MALQIPQPTDEARRALAAGAALFTDNDDTLTSILAQAPVGLRLFTLSLDDIGTNHFRIAKAAGWRFLARDQAGESISGEVTLTPQGQLKLTSVSREPEAEGPIHVVERIRHLAEVEAKDYELGILRIPGILLEALWLKSTTDDADLIVPVRAPSKELSQPNIFTVAECMNYLESLAGRYRAFDKYRSKSYSLNS